MRSVPYFNYPQIFQSDEAAYVAIFRDICSRGAFIAQKELVEFEESLARFSEVKHAVGVADGTDAIIIALKAAGIGQGDEVIFCSHTMVATAASVAFVGATPVAIDCGPDHMIDPTKIEAAITTRTKAILPTQLNGRTADMDAIKTIASAHGLAIVEDAAQALGSRFRGQCAGTFGIAGTISFYPAKTLGCFGDGGAILTNDSGVYEQLLEYRDHGRDKHGEVRRWGLNSRLDNLQAAILLHKLKSYPAVIERRRQIASMYQEMLGDLSALQLPPPPGQDERHFDIFQNYELEAENRDGLRAFLTEKGVGTLIQWGGSAVHQWKGLGFDVSLPYTERMFTRCLMLPVNLALSDDDVAYVASTVRNFYRKQGSPVL